LKGRLRHRENRRKEERKRENEVRKGERILTGR
jgi:hypothetical protein